MRFNAYDVVTPLQDIWDRCAPLTQLFILEPRDCCEVQRRPKQILLDR